VKKLYDLMVFHEKAVAMFKSQIQSLVKPEAKKEVHSQLKLDLIVMLLDLLIKLDKVRADFLIIFFFSSSVFPGKLLIINLSALLGSSRLFSLAQRHEVQPSQRFRTIQTRRGTNSQ
jgi:hypothetical protein